MIFKKLAVLLLGMCLSGVVYAQGKLPKLGRISKGKPSVNEQVTKAVALRTSQLPAVNPKIYAYLPENVHLAHVQKYMHKNNNHWPQIVPMVGNAVAARNLYLAIIQDHQGVLSSADRKQLYSLFLNNNMHSVQSIVNIYNRWKRFHSSEPQMPSEKELEMDANNPVFALWYPELFGQQNQRRYLELPFKWDTAVMLYFGQQLYPNELPPELMKIDVFRQNP